MVYDASRRPEAEATLHLDTKVPIIFTFEIIQLLPSLHLCPFAKSMKSSNKNAVNGHLLGQQGLHSDIKFHCPAFQNFFLAVVF